MTADVASASSAPQAPGRGTRILAVLQRIGKSLMLPIAVLPAAALMVRLGQSDMPWYNSLPRFCDIISTGGNSLLGNLPIIFAIGVAIGFAKKSDGSTAVAALVGYLVYNAVSMEMFSQSKLKDKVLGIYVKSGDIGVNDAVPAGGLHYKLDASQPNPTGVLGGIFVGIIAALLWQRYYRIKLPTWLGFFGGRRFVPIATALACVVLGVLMGWIWSPVGQWIDDLSNWIGDNSTVGAFVYGATNRALLPFGLHHILNSVPWFQFGTYTTPDGKTFHGDIARFLNGDKTAGLFMTGFFPIMMFALPGAALAMWQAAIPAKRKLAGSILIASALTSFVTGVTEPLEFAFMFVAPVLYVIHALLTGVSLSLMWALGAKDGFGFSAGGIDFVLNWGKATKPWLILIVGPIYFVVYYVLFTFVIRKFNLKTPGRETDEALSEISPADQPA